ncbi:MAG: DUF1385 domain-containing protein [Candidatus Marinimicrobia bacterium]|nr:DUF1385 domain-containing protein [Candidatus Neomarinimicrobiota bacterium]RKY61760.1 MAG: DUF1385 domain-containing protein [Candidatus Neomarinimicrobiota bacterium]
MNKKILVGGQAVIEGVMMRVPGAYATAVRKPDGSIVTDRHDFTSATEKHRFLKRPVLRGVVALFESLKIGLSTLQFSADIAIKAEEEAQGKEHKEENKFLSGLTMFFALVLAFGLFGFLPLYITTELLDIEKKAFAFNIVAGLWRILFFLAYLWIISLMKDVRRLFHNHGAEHKVVFTFEHGKELIVENTREYSTFHPRCGTSFIFIVLLASILMFALIDTIVIAVLGNITLPLRLVFHLLMLPLVSGVGYEFLKLTAKYQHTWWGRSLSAPGLWLQRITTRPPDDDQIEVAIVALKTAFGDSLADYAGQEFIAEAVE